MCLSLAWTAIQSSNGLKKAAKDCPQPLPQSEDQRDDVFFNRWHDGFAQGR
jgi:hypothetical protein